MSHDDRTQMTKNTNTTPRERGSHLVDALFEWVRRQPRRECKPPNHFQAWVSGDGVPTGVGLYEPSWPGH